jgi:hypothetical protein
MAECRKKYPISIAFKPLYEETLAKGKTGPVVS